jgi:cystathionine beta-lyase
MDFHGLEKICVSGVKMLLLCSPHNPVSRIWSEYELRNLAEICSRHGVIVVSDEINWDITLGGRKHYTAGRVKEFQGRLIVCTSCSKTFNLAGLEMSNLIIPDKTLREKFRKYLNGRHLAYSNALGLEAVKAAYADGDDWVDRQTAYLTKNAETACEFIGDYMPEVEVAKPEATYLLWLNMRHYGMTSEQLTRRIATAGAALNNGLHYGEDYDGFVRMNIACPREQLYAGLECIRKAVGGLILK